MLRNATGPWSPCNMSGLVAASGMLAAARVGPSTSTFFWMESPFYTTRMKRAFSILRPLASKRGARNQM